MEDRRGKISTTVDSTVRLLAYLGGIVLLWLMGLTVVAVVMRYVFNAPILGAQDISELAWSSWSSSLWPIAAGPAGTWRLT